MKPLAVIQELAYNTDNGAIGKLAKRSGVDLAAIVYRRGITEFVEQRVPCPRPMPKHASNVAV